MADVKNMYVKNWQPLCSERILLNISLLRFPITSSPPSFYPHVPEAFHTQVCNGVGAGGGYVSLKSSSRNQEFKVQIEASLRSPLLEKEEKNKIERLADRNFPSSSFKLCLPPSVHIYYTTAFWTLLCKQITWGSC